MHNIFHLRTAARAVAIAAVSALTACAAMGGGMGHSVHLSGAQEVPAVASPASGDASFTVGQDGSVSGSITTTGLAGTMAHIHIAPAGQNGPVVVPLVKTADGVWSAPAGAKLTAEQIKAYQAGGLYVNVHSAEHKGGEIRAQLQP